MHLFQRTVEGRIEWANDGSFVGKRVIVAYYTNMPTAPPIHIWNYFRVTSAWENDPRERSNN